MIAPLPDLLIEPIVRAALAEDLGRAGDVTSTALIPRGQRMTAVFAARAEGRVSGVDCARIALALLDPGARFEILTADGADVAANDGAIARVEGEALAVLGAERVALNLLGRLSGVATLTRAYVRAVEGAKARIVCTRKTTPGLRALEKYAVRCGGGVNHRFGLDDAILIKALPHRPDVIMLDNFALPDLREAVRRVAGAVVLEASGGVNLQSVRAIAETGVDAISVGALTHSAPVLDIGLDIA